jgi:hypothetical protein
LYVKSRKYGQRADGLLRVLDADAFLKGSRRRGSPGDYYGNSMIHSAELVNDSDSWMGLEFQMKLNPDPTTGAGAILEVWKNDSLIKHFDDTGPRRLSYWSIQ